MSVLGVKRPPKDYFKRLPEQRDKRPFLIGAIDTETLGLDGELTLVQSFHESWNEAAIYDTIPHMLEHIFNLDPALLRKTVWFSHNAEYDWRYMFEHFRAFSDRFIFQPIERMKGKFFQINVLSKTETTKNGKPLKVTIFRDSYALYPQSLADFTKNFAPDYVKQDIGLSYKNFDKTDATHIAYAKNDVIGLVHAISNFDAVVHEKFGVHVKGTFSSTAYNAMLRFIPDDEYHNRQRPAVEAFFRECYFGGRVQINAEHGRYYEDVTVFDINSSYPAAMRKGVPKGRATQVWSYRHDLPGFYKCVATVPDGLQMPLIPHRGDKGQLSFPTGTFEAYLSSLEIEYAVTLGCSFKIQTGYVFEDGLTNCFDDLIDVCEKMRAEYKKTPTEIVVKFIQNSVYGKFGTKPEGREILFSFDDYPDDFMPVIDEETGALIPYVYFKDTTREGEYMLPHYAAWITANARIALDKGMRAAGVETVLYADTDSLHVTRSGTDKFTANVELVGIKYGQYKLEKTLAEARYHAPKFYTFVVAGKETRQVQAVCKGIPASLVREPTRNDPDYKIKMKARDKLCGRLHAGEQVEVTYHSSASAQSYLKTKMLYSIRTRKSTLPDKIYGHIIERGKFRPRRFIAPQQYEMKFKIVRNITESKRA